MMGVLGNAIFVRLFAAQVIALLGTGLLTVALGLLAYDLAGARAGAVLGTALTIKMVAYVILSPVAGALFGGLPRKAVLIGADTLRGGIALCLPFVSEIWQVYGLIFALQAASATFTPAFQATIPDVLPDEGDYTRALSLSRLAYDIENLASPALAGVLLLVMGYDHLFIGTALGFAGSAILIAGTALPRAAKAARARPFRDRLLRGSRIYLATPRLRGLLALNMAASAVVAFVLVNTVVVVRVAFGGGEVDLALAMAAFGAGSMAAALMLPGLLERSGEDRKVMLQAGAALAGLAVLLGGVVIAVGWPGWGVVLLCWAMFGALYATIMTPSGRLLRRSAHAEDRAAVFTAQFALSHACWLLAYPFAGWVGATAGLGVALGLGGLVAGGAVWGAHYLWPVHTSQPVAHDHPDLPPDHPHLQHHGTRHAHVVVIDDEHTAWPTQG